jgi:hypothetical protein
MSVVLTSAPPEDPAVAPFRKESPLNFGGNG